MRKPIGELPKSMARGSRKGSDNFREDTKNLEGPLRKTGEAMVREKPALSLNSLLLMASVE